MVRIGDITTPWVGEATWHRPPSCPTSEEWQNTRVSPHPLRVTAQRKPNTSKGEGGKSIEVPQEVILENDVMLPEVFTARKETQLKDHSLMQRWGTLARATCASHSQDFWVGWD